MNICEDGQLMGVLDGCQKMMKENKRKQFLTLCCWATNADIQILRIIALCQCIVDALYVGSDIAINGALNADSCGITTTSSTNIYQRSKFAQFSRYPINN